ncbi:unnamed protein product [Rhizoctonia solani]|nr:unnamed protein product [Rhizoctonia solani]
MEAPRSPASSVCSSETGSWAQEYWGGKDLSNNVMEFGRRFYHHEGDWEPKPIKELAHCISLAQAHDEEEVTFTELEVLIRASRSWQLFDHLASDCPSLMRHAMDLLKSYCGDRNFVFEYYYGLLCIQLLSTTILAGIIQGSDERESTLAVIRAKRVGKIDIHRQLVVQSLGILSQSLTLNSNSEHKEEELRLCLNECYREGECVILPAFGGFYKEDAEYLLEGFWLDRISFLQASSTLSWQGTPGWSALLAVIWFYVRHTDDSTSTLPLRRLRNLILRYVLSAPQPENHFLDNIVGAIEKQIPSYTLGNEELPPDGKYDAHFMGMVFLKYLDVPVGRNLRVASDLMIFPFGLVYHNTLTTLPDRAPFLLKAVIERAWKILEETESKLTLQERILHSFDYALDAITSMWVVLKLPGNCSDQTIEVATVVWMKLLRNVNILELIGRLCSILVISGNNSGSELLIGPERLKDFLKHNRRLMTQLKGVIQAHALGDLKELSHTWHKVLRHIELQLLRYPPGGPVQHRARLCKSVWLEVGEAFGFFVHAPHQLQCMNPRCHMPYPDDGAQHICTRCCWVHYCSRRCQSLHWDDGSIDGHRNACLNLSTRE